MPIEQLEVDSPSTQATKPADPRMRRILRLQVPVIVRLAYRALPVGQVRLLAPGSIIEFEKSIGEDLDLLVNNHAIGRGTCVRIGEHFGIRLTTIADAARRIRSLGSDATAVESAAAGG